MRSALSALVILFSLAAIGASASAVPRGPSEPAAEAAAPATDHPELSKRAFYNPNVPLLQGNVPTAAGNFLLAPYVKSVVFTSGILGVCENGGISFKPNVKITVCNTQNLNPGAVTGHIVLRKGDASKKVIQTQPLNSKSAAAAPAGACPWGKGVVVVADAWFWFNEIPTAAPMELVAGVKFNNNQQGVGSSVVVLPPGKCGLQTGTF